MVLFFTREGKILVIKRTSNPLDPWSGQMALPGGKKEDGESCEETAKREAFEEVGIRPGNLHFLGIYSPNNAPNLKVSAYISCIESELEPKVDSKEVDKALWISLNELQRKDTAFYYDNYVIWGMTFRILRDVIEKKLYKICQSDNED